MLRYNLKGEITTWGDRVVYTKAKDTCTKKGDLFYDCTRNQWIFGKLEEDKQKDLMIMEENEITNTETLCPDAVKQWKINLDGRFRPKFAIDEDIQVVCEGNPDENEDANKIKAVSAAQREDVKDDGLLKLLQAIAINQESNQKQLSELLLINDNLTAKMEILEQEISKGLQKPAVVYEKISPSFLNSLAAPNDGSEELNAQSKTFVIGNTEDVVPQESYGFIKLNGSTYRKLFTQGGGTDILVEINLLGITKID